MEKRNTRRGFTLIELLVVVLIIGILAAIAVPQYQVAVVKSQLSSLKTLVQSVNSAAQVYYVANGVYPTSLDMLDVEYPAPISVTTSTTSTKYTYDWGYCNLYHDELTHSIACVRTEGNRIGYSKHFNDSGDDGRTECLSYTATPSSAKVCAQETGLSEPVWTNNANTYSAWQYN